MHLQLYHAENGRKRKKIHSNMSIQSRTHKCTVFFLTSFYKRYKYIYRNDKRITSKIRTLYTPHALIDLPLTGCVYTNK